MVILRFLGTALWAVVLLLFFPGTPAYSQTSWIVPGTQGTDVRSMTMVGSFGLLSVRQGVMVMDFSDAANPQFVSQLTLPDRWANVAGQFEIVVRHPYAFVPSWDVGFYVVDISDLSALTVVGQTSLPQAGRAVALYGDFAYVGGAWVNYVPGYVVDISTPAAPSVVDSFTFLDGGLFDVHVEGSLLYAASGHIYVVDLSSPTQPSVIDTFPLTGSCLSFVKRGDRVYATDAYIGSGLQGMGCFDVSNPASPVLLGKLSNAGGDIAIAVMNDHAWVANDPGGMYAVDVADPANPAWVICYTTGLVEPCDDIFGAHLPTGITLFDRFAFLADRMYGLVAYELDARGDASANGLASATDIILVVNYVFKGGAPPPSLSQADTNCDESITSSDVIVLVNHVFKSVNVPVCP